MSRLYGDTHRALQMAFDTRTLADRLESTIVKPAVDDMGKAFIESRDMFFLTTVSNMPALFVRHPEWHAAFDMDANAAEANRRKFFDRVIAEKAMMTGYHYGVPGAGSISKDGSGYAFVPVV